MSYSATSAVLKAFEKEAGYKIPPASPEIRAIGQKALYGGRCETYYVGDTRACGLKGELVHFDFKNQYAKIMAEKEFPDFRDHYFSKEPKEKNYVAWADVEVEAIGGISPLPCHLGGSAAGGGDVAGDSLVFPVGAFRGVWTSVDLEHPAIRVKKYRRTINFPASTFSFRGFVERFIPHGDNEIARAIKKNIYTSFSGKFSQGNTRTMILRNDPDKLKIEDYRTGVFFGDWVLVKRHTPYARFSNFIWTAFINSYGRQQLWKLFEAIWQGQGRPIYADTDGVVAMMPSVHHAKKVLELFPERLKLKVKEMGYMLGPKCYLTRDKQGVIEIAARGIPSKLHSQIGAAGDEVWAEVPDTFFQAMRRGAAERQIKNTWTQKSFTFSQKKSLARVLHGDGWTSPLRLPLKGKKA